MRPTYVNDNPRIALARRHEIRPVVSVGCPQHARPIETIDASLDARLHFRRNRMDVRIVEYAAIEVRFIRKERRRRRNVRRKRAGTKSVGLAFGDVLCVGCATTAMTDAQMPRPTRTTNRVRFIRRILSRRSINFRWRHVVVLRKPDRHPREGWVEASPRGVGPRTPALNREQPPRRNPKPPPKKAP